MDSIESLASAVREYRDLTHDTANKAADALELLGMVERHGWQIDPGHLDDGSTRWVVQAFRCGHFAPTLTEALTEASRCPKCTGGK